MKKQKIVTKNSSFVEEVGGIAADEIVDAIGESIPGLNIAYKIVKAYMGRGMKLRQQRVLEWVEFVRDNIGEFSKQLFDNEQFQDCFVLLTEGYVRERTNEKRKIYQQILLGITKLSFDDLEKYQLERMSTVTNQISLEALNVLSFIKTNLLSKIEEDIKEKLKAFKYQEGVEGIRLEDVTRNRILVSEYISHWVYENYNSNSEIVKKKYNLSDQSPQEIRDKIVYEEHLKEKELNGPLPELANLGILIKKDGSPAIGGTVGSGYSISEFGYLYLDYLEKYSIKS